MIFRQLFDKKSSAYTYLLAHEQSGEAVFIDPVADYIEDYLTLLDHYGCKLKYSLETHVHADHITGSGLLKQRTNAQTGVNQQCGAVCADMQLKHGDTLTFGDHTIHVIATPGHTPGSTSFLIDDRLFTGDALMIDSCGRTDFQGGDAGAQYDSIVQRLFTLPDETLVYPGHDYTGKWVSCIGQERMINARLAGKTREAFSQIMNNLNLPNPKLIDIAVSANRKCGIQEATEALPQS
jgi:glyoxylase-like metal-dependent hydrolase (beta-lactamase superfamily II)